MGYKELWGIRSRISRVQQWFLLESWFWGRGTFHSINQRLGLSYILIDLLQKEWRLKLDPHNEPQSPSPL